MFLFSPSACFCATDGSSMTDMELVMADGKNKRGITMPVRIPNRLKACVPVRPNRRRRTGIRMFSMLVSEERRTRLQVRGIESVMISFAV